MGTRCTQKNGAQQHPSNFRAMYCGQTAGWIKMPLGTKVGLRPGDIVLDGDPTPCPQRGTAPPPPIFRPMLWLNGWTDQNATWHGGRPQQRPCIRWGPNSSPSEKRALQPLPIFSPCLLWCGGRLGPGDIVHN